MPLFRRLGIPSVTTLHGRLDIPELGPMFEQFPDVPLVSISDAQRRPIPRADWCATVHHGLPRDLLPFRPAAGDYLAFVGRLSPEKRPDRAIEIAARAGVELRIAAKVDRADRRYFEQTIEPMLARPGVTFLGELGECEKAALIAGARALLFPIDWPEPSSRWPAAPPWWRGITARCPS
jgi:glycosyltransferase involved in cell wall biosynthesis